MPPVMLRRRELLVGAGVALVAASLGGCGRPGWQEATGRVRIATRNVGAVFDRYGEALAVEVARAMPGVAADTLGTGGSVDNVTAVAEGRAEVGFCLGDTAVLAGTGGQGVPRVELAAVTRLYDSFLQVLVRADSPVRSLSDLAGRRLTAGEQGSGTRLVVTRSLTAAGVPGDAVQLLGGSLGEAARALVAGESDALAFVSGFPIPAVVELGRLTPLRAVDLAAVVAGPIDKPGPVP